MSIIDTAKDVYALVTKGLTIDLEEKLMELREQALRPSRRKPVAAH